MSEELFDNLNIGDTLKLCGSVTSETSVYGHGTVIHCCENESHVGPFGNYRYVYVNNETLSVTREDVCLA